MIQRRLYKPCELTALGICRETLRVWRKDPDFPQPVRGKFYDIKAIEAYLDKLGRINSQSAPLDYEKILEERLAQRGINKGEISRP